MTVRIIEGDCRETLKTLDAQSIQCCVTSPPYYGLRDYGHPEQLGLEKTPQEYVEKMVRVFREVKRVLRDDGTLWLNIGDSYATGGGSVGRAPGGGEQGARFLRQGHINTQPNRMPLPGLKPKDLIGIPWMLAFALRADGWYLRSDIIWHKPNPMPESVTDRPTKSHEYVFLLSKSERYFYDADAIREPLQPSTLADRRLADEKYEAGRPDRGFPGEASKGGGLLKPRRSGNKERKSRADYGGNPELSNSHQGFAVPWEDDGSGRNARSVWTINTQAFKGAHFDRIFDAANTAINDATDLLIRERGPDAVHRLLEKLASMREAGR